MVTTNNEGNSAKPGGNRGEKDVVILDNINSSNNNDNEESNMENNKINDGTENKTNNTESNTTTTNNKYEGECKGNNAKNSGGKGGENTKNCENTNNSNQTQGNSITRILNHSNTNETVKGSTEAAAFGIETNKSQTEIPAGTGVKNSNVEDFDDGEKDAGDSSGNGNNSNIPNPKNKQWTKGKHNREQRLITSITGTNKEDENSGDRNGENTISYKNNYICPRGFDYGNEKIKMTSKSGTEYLCKLESPKKMAKD